MTSLNKAQPHLIPITYMDGLTLAQRHHCNSDVGPTTCAILDEAQNGLPHYVVTDNTGLYDGACWKTSNLPGHFDVVTPVLMH